LIVELRKLAEEIPMSAVQLDASNPARSQRRAASMKASIDRWTSSRVISCAPVSASSDGHCGARPVKRDGRSHPGVVQLDTRVGVVRFDSSCESSQPFEVVIAVDTQLSGKPTPFFLHGGRAGHGQAELAFARLTTSGTRHRSTDRRMALTVGHRASTKPILEGSTAGEGQGLGQHVHAAAIVQSPQDRAQSRRRDTRCLAAMPEGSRSCRPLTANGPDR